MGTLYSELGHPLKLLLHYAIDTRCIGNKQVEIVFYCLAPNASPDMGGERANKPLQPTAVRDVRTTPSKSWNSKTCNKTYSNSLKQQMQVTHEGHCAKCPACPRAFGRKSELRHHLAIAHKGERHTYSTCLKQYKSKDGLCMHQCHILTSLFV